MGGDPHACDTGTVEVVMNKAKSCEAITVTLKASACVLWSDTDDDERQVHYRSREDYLDQKIVLWNTEQIPNRILQPGQYIFPFNLVRLTTGLAILDIFLRQECRVCLVF